MQKKFVLIFILLSVKCFAGELINYHGDNRFAMTDAFSKNGRILWRACVRNSTSRVKEILGYDVDVNYEGNIKYHHREAWIVREFAQERNPNFDCRAFDKLFTRTVSTAYGKYKYMREDSISLTPLECALINKNEQIIKLLLSKGGTARAKYIAFRDKVELVDIILKEHLITPYEIAFEAAENSKNEILLHLLKTNEFSQNQLKKLLNIYVCAERVNFEILNFFLKNIKNINITDFEINSILCIRGIKTAEIIYQYLRKDVISIGINQVLKKAYGNYAIMSILLKNGASPNLIYDDNSSETLLMHAARAGRLDWVKLLIKNGADRKLKNKHGDTASIIALQEGHQSIYNYLNNVSISESCYLL